MKFPLVVWASHSVAEVATMDKDDSEMEEDMTGIHGGIIHWSMNIINALHLAFTPNCDFSLMLHVREIYEVTVSYS